MKKQVLLDQGFVEIRSKVLDVAAFLDRVDRAPGEEDFRIRELRKVLPILTQKKQGRAKRVLVALSDPSRKPIAAAGTKSAAGAYNAGGK